jgi:tetratricopeptide (TPR) repeat protein
MTVEAIAPRKARRKNVREVLPDTPDPIEIAMVAAASGKPLPDAARNVLEKHARLIDAQCSELKLRRVGEGVRAVLWGTLAVAAFAVLALILALVVRASRSDALIVQSFRVPPALEAKGLGGEVIATQVLDKLAEMQSGTNSVRAASTYANNWEDELKIDIPNTGTSADQIWKLLRGWLGKETRISGEVVDTGKGLALTARVGSTPGQRFQNPEGDLDALVTKGAELIYRQTQPYRYAMYMSRSGRKEERLPILKQLTVHASPIERKWAYSGLSFHMNGEGEFRESIRMADRALAIDPDMIPALANGARARELLGHQQSTVDMYLKSRKIGRGGVEYDPTVAALNQCALYDSLAFHLRDPSLFDKAAACFEAADGLDTDTPAAARVSAALLRHDPAPALRLSMKPSPDSPAEWIERYLAGIRLEAVRSSGSSSALATALDEFRRAALVPASSPYASAFRAAAPTQDWPREAEVLLMLGRAGEAQALIARTPLDCYNCVRVRGRVAQAQGDAAGAQRWFAEAVRQGPRLPAGYVDWGRLLAQRRQFASAEERFSKAARLAPNWADPLKYWGDSLAAQRKPREAIDKYDAAWKLAPKWQELGQARARLRPSR